MYSNFKYWRNCMSFVRLNVKIIIIFTFALRNLTAVLVFTISFTKN
jgi:hypothetical protein